MPQSITTIQGLMALPRAFMRRAAAFLLLATVMIVPGLTTIASAVDTIGSKVDTIQGDLTTKLDPGTAKTAPALTEITANAQWIVYLLWLVVPLLVYGTMVPFVIIKAKANDMDAVKTGIISLIIGSVLYFGVLIVFFG